MPQPDTSHSAPNSQAKPILAPVLAVALIGMSLTAVAFRETRRLERKAVKADFMTQANLLNGACVHALSQRLEVIEAIALFYEASPEVLRDQFSQLVHPYCARYSGIRRLGWISAVPDSDRARCELAARRDGIERFQIVERDAESQLVRAAERAHYLPIYYIEPYAGGSEIMGLDLASDPTAANLLAQARDSGRYVTTVTKEDECDGESTTCLRVFAPVYDTTGITLTLEGKRKNLRGYVFGVFTLGPTVEKELAMLGSMGVAMELRDESGVRWRQMPSDPRRDDIARRTTGQRPGEDRADLTSVHPFRLADREWTVHCAAGPGFLRTHARRNQWWVLLSGLVVTAASSLYLRAHLMRAAWGARLVNERTWELCVANEELAREVADRKQAEHELRTAKDYAENLIETANAMVVGMDKDGRVTVFNQTAERITGYQRSEVSNENWFDVIAPRDRYPDAWSEFERLLAGGVPRNFESPILTKGGEERYIVWQSNNAGEQGDAVGTIAFGIDITERKQAEAELQSAQKRLVETAHRAGMADVASEVLHNVGNILNSVNVAITQMSETVAASRVDALAKVVTLLDEHREDLGAFLKEDPQGKHIPVFLTEISTLFRTERDHLVGMLEGLTKNVQHIKDTITTQQSYARVLAVEEPTSLVEPIEDAIQINQAALERHEVRLVREFESLPVVQINKQKVVQILVNLINNGKYALSHSERSDKVMHIRLRQHGDSRFRIEVIDNGIGMTRETLGKIFRHGFTTKQDGHGFGLHSAALAAKEMGGALRADSDGPGRGAVFTLELPLNRVEATTCMTNVT